MEETKQDKPRPAWKRFQLSYMNRMTAEECYNITRREATLTSSNKRISQRQELVGTLILRLG